MRRYDNVNGSDMYGNPVLEIPQQVLESITRNGVRLLSYITCCMQPAARSLSGSDALTSMLLWEAASQAGSVQVDSLRSSVPLPVMCAWHTAGEQVCLKGTLFTPLSEHNTSTQSLNVQLRKVLDLHVNLVHGWTMPGVPTRFSDVDIVVIRYCCCSRCRHVYCLSTR